MQVFSSECKQLKGELPNSLHRDLCNTATHTPEKCRFVKGIQEKTRKHKLITVYTRRQHAKILTAKHILDHLITVLVIPIFNWLIGMLTIIHKVQ